MRIAGLVVWLVACSAPAHPVAPPQADILLVHCRGSTDAIAIRGDRIVAIGDQAKRFAAHRRIDVHRQFVIPGFHDAHVHEPVLFDADWVEGSSFDSPDKTIYELTVAARDAQHGRWLHGILGDPALEGASLTQQQLDQAAPDNPVWLDNNTGHVVVLNSSAEKQLAIPANPSRAGWHFEYERYRAMSRRAASASDTDIANAAALFEAEASSFGITSVTAFPLDVDVDRLARVLRASPRKLRWHIVRTPLDGVITPPPPTSDPYVTVEGTKYFIDGMHVERGAAMTEEYADALTMGQLDFSYDDIVRMLEAARTTGDTLHLHVVGDRAITLVLDAIERVPGAPVVLEHAHLLRDIPRARRLGVSIVATPAHESLVAERLGAARATWWMPLGQIVAAGIPLSIGSDGDLAPSTNIFRTTQLYSPLTSAQALRAYTDNRELVPGAIADVAVLTYPVDLPSRSVLTIVGGEIVYEASPASAPTSARTE